MCAQAGNKVLDSDEPVHLLLASFREKLMHIVQHEAGRMVSLFDNALHVLPSQCVTSLQKELPNIRVSEALYSTAGDDTPVTPRKTNKGDSGPTAASKSAKKRR